MTHIYTDGACLLNNTDDLAIGLCGMWDEFRDVFVIDRNLNFGTTAYNMELKAIRLALEYIEVDCVIYCDSMQVIANLTKVKNRNKKPKSKEEIQTKKLFELKKRNCKIEIQWVKSHSDNVGNNTIDQKLEQEIAKLIQELPTKKCDQIINIVKERYNRKGCFESFSKEFFDELLKLQKYII
jgi:ribonuclease HI